MMKKEDTNKNDAKKALKKAIEVRAVWMQALMGMVGKAELEEKDIHFITITE